jgi:phospholipase A1
MTDKKVNDRIKYDMASNNAVHVAGLPCWLWQLVEETQWVGPELRLSSKEYLSKIDVATCH